MLSTRYHIPAGGRQGTKLKGKQTTESHTRASVGGVGNSSLVKAVACLFQKVSLSLILEASEEAAFMVHLCCLTVPGTACARGGV